jgi:cell division FtsZ-interacting protein ZapD
MYLLHKQEKIFKSDQERINALNRQLMMESSELQSGVTIYQKSKEELLMFAPIESDEVSI